MAKPLDPSRIDFAWVLNEEYPNANPRNRNSYDGIVATWDREAFGPLPRLSTFQAKWNAIVSRENAITDEDREKLIAKQKASQVNPDGRLRAATIEAVAQILREHRDKLDEIVSVLNSEGLVISPLSPIVIADEVNRIVSEALS